VRFRGQSGLVFRVPGAAAALLLCVALSSCSSAKTASATQPAPPAPAITTASIAEPLRSAIDRINFYRMAAGVPPVTTTQSINAACVKHSTYIVKNRIQGSDAIFLQDRLRNLALVPGVREESVGNQWYTEEGAAAARQGYVIRGATAPADGAALIDQIASMGFSAFLVVNPQLSTIGYGQYCDGSDCAATFTTDFGLEKPEFRRLYDSSEVAMWNPHLGKLRFVHARLRKPVEMPPAGFTLPIAAYDGGANPDPLSSCLGYSAPSGVPIILALGASVEGEEAEVKASKHLLEEDGVEVESCAFDASSYANPNGYDQRIARDQLQENGAIVVVSKAPFKAGHSYAVSITADGQKYDWSFRVAADAH
jgi:hypothetical protein